MVISFELPEGLEDVLRGRFGDLALAAKEALIVECYRRGDISLGKVAELLGFATRFEAEEWLAARGVCLNYGLTELEADRATLERLFPQTPR
jgi:predicted HTH domain antitoxin